MTILFKGVKIETNPSPISNSITNYTITEPRTGEQLTFTNLKKCKSEITRLSYDVGKLHAPAQPQMYEVKTYNHIYKGTLEDILQEIVQSSLLFSHQTLEEYMLGYAKRFHILYPDRTTLDTSTIENFLYSLLMNDLITLTKINT